MNRTIVLFMDSSHKVIMEKKLTGIPLSEQHIIAKSIEQYNDPEPCMIHRSAVMKRMYFELYEYLKEYMPEYDFVMPWSRVPENLRLMVNVFMNAHFIAVRFM